MSPIPPNILMTFRKNLDALRTVDGSLAERLGEFDWPNDLKFLSALDGTPSAFGKDLSQSGWFAFSGSPKIREQVLCEYFNAGEANVILPGCGQGYGLTVLLSKFARWQTVFVWEPKLLNIAILLGLWDFSTAIADRRLVFLTQDELEKSLVDYIRANQELTLPTKMLAWPWIEETKLGQLPLAIERAIAKMNPVISQMVETLQAGLKEAFEKITERNERRVQIFGLISTRPGNRLAADLDNAVKKIGDRSDVFLVDRPGHYGVVGMLKDMIKFEPDTIISVGVSKKNWGVTVPSNVAFTSFLTLPGARLGAKALDGLTAPETNERYILGDRSECEVLRNRLGSEDIYAMESAVNPEAFYPLTESHEHQIIVLANYGDTEPKTWGVFQESHQKLWSQIARMVEEAPLGYYESGVKALIDRASQLCGVRLGDSQLIESLENLVKTILAPLSVVKAIVTKLSQEGFKIRLVGSGWDKAPSLLPMAQAMPEEPEELNRILHSGDIILYLDSETNRRQVVFDSLCAGRVVMVRRLPEDRWANLPEIEEMLVYLEANVGLIEQVRTAIRNLPTLRERMKQQRCELVEKYSFEKQIREILKES